MISDNIIIIPELKKKSGAIEPKSKSVLMRCLNLPTSATASIRVTRKTKNGNAAFNDLQVATGYQKINIQPYNTLELEVRNWHLLPDVSDFQVKIVNGDNMELIFYEIKETLMSYNFATGKNVFGLILGRKEASYIQVVKCGLIYECQLFVSNESFYWFHNFKVQPKTSLEKLFFDIHGQIEIVREHHQRLTADEYQAKIKDGNFNRLLNKHFKPAIH
jgi:hypothetical protein